MTREGAAQLYFGFGLTIESTLAIPGAMCLAAAPDQADVRVTEGHIVFNSESPARGSYRTDGGRLLFDAPGVARYLCSEDEIIIEREAAADRREAAELLIATALPAALWMRGSLVLHAAAAILPGSTRALAVSGPSGAGKSTILQRLVEQGATSLADDSIALTRDGVASGLPGGVFLRSGATRREFLPFDFSRQARSAQLGALIVLKQVEQGRAGFERLSPLAALKSVLHARHRPTIPLVLGALERVLGDCAILARTVPLYVWRREAEPTSAEEFAELARLGGVKP